MSEPIGVAILGCGNISGPYLDDLKTWPAVQVVGCFDLDAKAAKETAEKHGLRAYATLRELLDDPETRIVANLTSHSAHVETTTASLRAGKHVHVEKPLAPTGPEAWQLVAEAEALALRLGCSPFTWFGPSQRATLRAARESIGKVRVATAEILWDKIESWHPSPESFYRVGPFADVAVYPVTMLTAAFGPVVEVQAFGRVLQLERKDKSGQSFSVGRPDWIVANLALEIGLVVRITASFYAGKSPARAAMELFGDDGTVRTPDWLNMSAAPETTQDGKQWDRIDVSEGGYVRWGLGIADMAAAIRDDRPHRATGAHGAHLVDVIEAVHASLEAGQPVPVTSGFAQPELGEVAL